MIFKFRDQLYVLYATWLVLKNMGHANRSFYSIHIGSMKMCHGIEEICYQ